LETGLANEAEFPPRSSPVFFETRLAPGLGPGLRRGTALLGTPTDVAAK